MRLIPTASFIAAFILASACVGLIRYGAGLLSLSPVKPPSGDWAQSILPVVYPNKFKAIFDSEIGAWPDKAAFRSHDRPAELLTPDVFWAEDIKTKTGAYRNWAGLYRRGNKYFLIPSSVRIRRQSNRTYSAAKKVSTNVALPNIFLIRNMPALKFGHVKTLFFEDSDNPESMYLGYSRTFDFNGTSYTLKPRDPTARGRSLTDRSVLTLTAGDLEQVIYRDGGCADCSWTVRWVGDLDRDGKLDFLLDLSNYYNFLDTHLFLSSHAGRGRIVREVASLHTSGC